MIPKSIPTPLLVGTSVLSSTSIPTLIQKLIPSKVTLGFKYLQSVGILPFSANLTQFSLTLFFLVELDIFSNLTWVSVNLILTLSVEEVNKILVGLDYYQKDIKGLSEKIVAVSEGQIAEFNKKLQEENEKATQSEEEAKNKKGKEK